jgi:hypothetical protein
VNAASSTPWVPMRSLRAFSIDWLIGMTGLPSHPTIYEAVAFRESGHTSHSMTII